jgi:RNA-binding protein
MRRIGHAPAFAIKRQAIQARAPMTKPRAKAPTKTKRAPRAKAPATNAKAPAGNGKPPAARTHTTFVALSSAQRRGLRAQAHHLEPIVQVGHSGVTDGVIAAVREALRAHELIKVRLHEPEDKKGMAEALAAGSVSTLCGLVGHTAILYKRHPKLPKIEI